MKKARDVLKKGAPRDDRPPLEPTKKEHPSNHLEKNLRKNPSRQGAKKGGKGSGRTTIKARQNVGKVFFQRKGPFSGKKGLMVVG